ncbi:MAG TPA: hypothetical protein IAB35_01910 [Candidatus Faecimonas gallistercoris]|nr:hypothetical protein [Candidatus Faecimonas gallistercoris]
MLEELILFLLCFLLVLLVYELFIVRKAKKNKSKKYPMEVKYLINRYHLNMRKVDYPQLLQIVALVSSFDIAFIVSVVMFVDNYLWQILSVLILVLPVIFVSYHFVGSFYRKRGMTKDE